MALKMITRRSNNALLISISLHIIVAIILAGSPVKHYIRQYSSGIYIDWVEDVPEPELKRELPKQPIEMKFDPNRLDLDAKKKSSKASPSKLTWVKKRSNRLVERSVELNDADQSDTIPNIMTAARIRYSATNLSGMISTAVGPIDGRGIVGNQVRAAGKGTKSGVALLGLGGEGDGLVGGGGGGGGGLIDRLGIINFMSEADGPQKVVYCLDVSASMTMGAKLSISIKALKESMLQLSDFDKFNIVTFHSSVHSFKKESLPASMANLEKAERFLNSFTPRNIENNQGTDILAALKYALSMNPTVIVLITDIQPTRGEVDENRIVAEVKKLNKNTRIYGIGVEVWKPSPNGRLAKLLKMLTEQNDGEMRLASAS